MVDEMDTPSSALVLWSTSTGRSKACARRACRMLRSRGISIVSTNAPKEAEKLSDLSELAQQPMFGGCAFDEFGPQRLLNISAQKNIPWIILFVSTTGDGENCDTIQQCWTAL